MRSLRVPVVLLLALVMLTGCSTFSKSLVVSGTSLATLGDQFAQVSAQVTAGCDSKVIPQSVCDKYRVFGENFKKTYPITVGLWKAARDAGDKAAQSKAEDVIRQLSVSLSAIAIEALGSFVEVK